MKRIGALLLILSLVGCTPAVSLSMNGTTLRGHAPEGTSYTLTVTDPAAWGVFPNTEYGRLDDGTFHYGLLVSPPGTTPDSVDPDTTVIYIADIPKNGQTFENTILPYLFTDATVQELVDEANASIPDSLTTADVILENGETTINGLPTRYNGRECRKACTASGVAPLNLQYFIDGGEYVHVFVIGTAVNETAKNRVSNAVTMINSFQLQR